LQAALRTGRLLPALAVGFLLALAASSVPAGAQGVVRSTYGDWELRCEPAQGARPEQCILYQNVADESKPDLNLVVVILRVSEPDASGQPGARRPVLRVIAPLGILLPRGLGLRITSATQKDDKGEPLQKDIGSTGFVKCVPSGCVAEVDMDNNLVTEFRGGKVATFIVFETPNEGRGLPLNLTGFEQGFAALR
jgi:invasion protein IalB